MELLQSRFTPVLAEAGGQAGVLAAELFAVVDALDGSSRLRRALTEPTSAPQAKADLVARVLRDADPRTRQIVSLAAQQRWSTEADLAEALEELAFAAELAGADGTGQLDRVQEELFTIIRGLSGQRELRRVLRDELVPARYRAALVDEILGGDAAPATAALARRAAVAPRGRRFVATVSHLADLVAERRSREVATVTAAYELSPAQLDRLAGILEQLYGRRVEPHVTVDPSVVGGLRVQIGPDVLDATVLARLLDARRRLAG